MNDQFEYINNYYGTSYREGCRVAYTGDKDGPKLGTVVGASGAHIRVKLDGEKRAGTYHPTWEMGLIRLTDKE